jgi:hypothetical protein
MEIYVSMFAGAAWLMSGLLAPAALLAFGFGHKDFTAQAAFEQFCTLGWLVAFRLLVIWPFVDIVLVYAWRKRVKGRT